MVDRLDKISSYFNEKERRRLDQKTRDSKTGLPDMTADEVRLTCLENNGYETPELNDKLYLHFRGFRKIENLEAYTGCKSIWLDSNGFDTIENLDKMTELRCLYLSKNLISQISGLDLLHNLVILDLSYNRLTFLSNLSVCKNLQTLNVAHNALASVDSIKHLQECTSLTTIDLTNNRLEADESFYDVLKGIPSMVSLSINGNEIAKLPAFRKRLIGQLPKLGYLDRPVDEQERVCADAFAVGGPDAETAARNLWREQQQQKRINEMAEYRAWQVEQQKIRDQARAELRSLITEFTPEEQEERRKEAEAAAEAERRMLDIGIDKLANKYWQMEARGGNGDILDQAAQVLLDEHSTKPSEEPLVEETTNEIVNEEEITIAIEESPQIEEIVSEIIELSVEETKEIEDKAKEAALARKKEQEEEYLRQQRVQDSFEIYKRQQEAKKKTSNQPSLETNPWGDPILLSKPLGEILFWSEVMDIELAKQVKTTLFDFETISSNMQEMACQGKLDNSVVHKNPEILTRDVCRIRWSELDADNWSVQAPGSTANDILFRNNLPEEFIKNAGGVQPSYEALASMAAGSKPTYLKVPTQFPSIRDMDDLDLELD